MATAPRAFFLSARRAALVKKGAEVSPRAPSRPPAYPHARSRLVWGPQIFVAAIWGSTRARRRVRGGEPCAPIKGLCTAQRSLNLWDSGRD